MNHEATINSILKKYKDSPEISADLGTLVVAACKSLASDLSQEFRQILDNQTDDLKALINIQQQVLALLTTRKES